MPFAVYALAAINFAVGTQGFVFAGLFGEMAEALGVTLGRVGLLVAATSITFALGAPIAVALVARFEKRRVILVALLALALVNAASALALGYWSLLILRILAGVCTAFVGSLATVAAAALVPADKRGRAFAIVIGGLTVAFVMGVPIGSAIGGIFGWRATFWYASAICLLSCLLIQLWVPTIAAQAQPRPDLAALMRDRQIVSVLLLTLLSFTATFTVVAFIGPVINHATGARGGGVGALQAFIGVGSILGLALGGRLADAGKAVPATRLAFALMAVSLLFYYLVLNADRGGTPAAAMALLITVGAMALFSLIPMNLTRLAAAAGSAAPIVLALNGSLVSLGQGMGAVWGGLVTDLVSPAAMGPAGALVALTGLVLASRRLR